MPCPWVMKRPDAPDCQNCPIRRHSVLDCCTPEELELISLDKTCQHYQRGQFVFREGSRAHGLYCVHSGHLKVSKMGGDGKEQIVRLVKPGDVLGYRALLADDTHSADAVALDDAVVCQLPRADFFQLVERNAPFSISIMKLLANVLGEAEERLLHMAYKPVRERLAEALLLLLRTYPPLPEAPGQITIVRDDLAALVGTAKETVSRFMAEFKHEGLLSTKGSHITVLDADRLLAISTLYD
jgi:CRP/FNR family transcriptional regulator, polysaccharide utilization system transcription regulator